MSHFSDKPFGEIQHIQEVVKKIFPQGLAKVERVTEGVSTYAYRIIFPHAAPPEVIYFEHYNELLQRSVMVITEIKGLSMSQSSTLSQVEIEGILGEAGQDLACLNTVRVEGFGWVRRDLPETKHLRAEWPAHRTFALEYWEADMAYLAKHVLQHSEVALLERVLSLYDSWLDSEQGYLAHGDFDTTQIYQGIGRYTGIIDFGEIRGADRWYDLGNFHMRDGGLFPFRLRPALVCGYRERVSLPSDYEQHIRFTGLLINVRALVRSLQKRPPNRFTQHQLDVLREDIAALL